MTEPMQQYRAPETSTLAIVSLVSGIISFLILPFIGGIVAIITGNKAKKDIAARPAELSGDGLAKAGVILGWINLAFVVIPLCLIIVLSLTGSAITNIFSEIATGVQ